jgi:hypothetical protein
MDVKHYNKVIFSTINDILLLKREEYRCGLPGADDHRQFFRRIRNQYGFSEVNLRSNQAVALSQYLPSNRSMDINYPPLEGRACIAPGPYFAVIRLRGRRSIFHDIRCLHSYLG